MKKWLLIPLIALVVWHWDSIKPQVHQSDVDASAIRAGEVVLYATSWCGYCAKTRRYFDKHGIDYREYDIESSPEGKRQYDALNGRGVPLVTAGGTIIRGYNPSALAKIAETSR